MREYEENLCYLETNKEEIAALAGIDNQDDPLLKIKSPNQTSKQARVGTFICDRDTKVSCVWPDLTPVKCQHASCNKTVHHLCQIAWEGMNRVEEEGCATYCRKHNRFWRDQ